ncbi:Woronin body major protein [Fulvia fulva]|nr:Woronin body major protein [Fulvia fulva]
MGYYDDEGHYHSFRHGLHKAADRIIHPFESHDRRHHHHHSEGRVEHEEDVVVKDREVTMSAPRYDGGERSYRAERRGVPNTITIPCHHIRIGDLLILQGRPCQVIRITTSAQTGQHRYLGVDLFTKQLHEESSFVSNPSPSVVVQNMIGPIFKQYRVLDIRDNGRVVAMTETGDVKQGLPVLDQSSLLNRLQDSFNNGRGSVRVLVISDEGRELAVDYKVVHGSRL